MSSFPARIGVAAGLGIVALIALGTTLWFLGDALMLWIESQGLAPAAAAGLTGVAGLVLIVVLGLCAKLALRGPRRRVSLPATATPPGVNGVANGIAADLGALAAQQIVSTTRAHPYSTMGAALAAGIAVGAVPELRKTMMGLFKH
ncbi:MAG TPA: hypothetical protein VG308_12225 [Stellaceae bacterium]|jgi:hypothetical protein|nr:hypothetical protein [Stellaceae bacterium]